MDKRYNVILTGVSSSAPSREKVIECVAHLFGLSEELVEQLFSRAPVAVKRSVDRQTAEDYRQMILIAGGACEIQPARQEATAPPGAPLGPPLADEPCQERQQAAPPTLAADPQPPDAASAPAAALAAEQERNKGASILTIDERVLQRAAALAALPEEGSVSASGDNRPSPSAGKRCPKCGHVRHSTEVVPDYECPKCGIVYFKYEAYLARQRQEAQPPEAPAAAGAPGLHQAVATVAKRAPQGRSVTRAKHPRQRSAAHQLRTSGSYLILGATLLFVMGRLLQHCGLERRAVTNDLMGIASDQPTATAWFGLSLMLAVALPLAIWGGVRIARSKWRHDVWGLLGCFSLFGLYLLHRLTDHRPAEPAEESAGAAAGTSG